MHFAKLIVDAIWGDDLADFSDDDQALRSARQSIVKFMKAEDTLDYDARTKVASLKRNVIEGSPEWDILYRKYYEEEVKRRG